MRPNTGLAYEARSETLNGIADWLTFERTLRKIIVRRPGGRTFTTTERAALDAARTFLERGEISIITRRVNGIVTFVAERTK
jgi:hypothetical protein